ncbi:oxygenase MpaB family protein [Gandjariella thermophila]|uniref:Peptidase n=1 Tax=Gandjariella thermophila TaxID=1931992 RepID=A0A4D4JCX0_9PSEU|nr:oxygenase MpaB family protein [Gandjariella thermophila]GDY32508.1 peptidase [Gandjariella thermophila]
MTGYWLRRIQRLDPVADHQEIYRISAGFEFPWDYTRALEFALFRTYCVPSISGLLAATGEFEKRTQKRYDDTSLLMQEISEHGYDSPRGREAIRMINRMHGRYAISNDDMRYVLSTFVYDPIDWIDRFGWRRLHEHERLAAFHHFRAIGARMAIKDIPADDAEFRRFKTDYEREHFRYSDTNRQIGGYTLDLFCSWYPRPLRPAVATAARGLLDPAMLAAFGFPPAPAWVGPVARAGLRARSAVVRLLPRRRRSRLTREPRNRTYRGYPHGYTPGDLGAPEPPADLDRRWLRGGERPESR